MSACRQSAARGATLATSRRNIPPNVRYRMSLRALRWRPHILHCANARKLKADGIGEQTTPVLRKLLLFRQKPYSSKPSRHKVKVLYQVNGAARGCSMKRRTARQLVRLLSDLRHSAHCSTLRAAATNRAMELAAAEEEEQASDGLDETREKSQNERVWRGS
jgi:hypothetical protein